MANDHIIPRFILKGFAINPEANVNEQEVMLYDKLKNEIFNEKISKVYAIENFNSYETETLLSQEYENKVATIFQRVVKRSDLNEKFVELSNSEYKLLFRFFTVMWRRNDIQMDKSKHFFKELMNDIEKLTKYLSGIEMKSMLKEEFKNITHDEMFELKKDVLRKPLYDNLIKKTTINDPIVQKTLKNYTPLIVLNNSDTNFLLHNTYATNIYFGSIINEDFPELMIFPITKKLCFCLVLSKEEIDITKEKYKLSIEVYPEKLIKEIFVKKYITKTATSVIVDETNLDIVKNIMKEEK